ncbi:TetR/AcrR family transcriptional regulator [Actinoplanes sp. NPDC049681]|uniref:TetR/AcrR family transcriptional regulator n=1 Tax=Actinoplanes sp. NPDC049681 TaxID=3363905 RepID=UPI0037AF031F
MARPAEPGRRALLDAGAALLGDPGGPSLAGMSVNAVVARAGMSKGAFYQHWKDRGAFLVALHRRFHDELQAAVMDAVRDLSPGLPRLTAGLTAYLDGCLASPEARALLFQARHDGALTPEVEARNAAFTAVAEPDLILLGWQPPAAAASLLIAMAVHIAAIENAIRAPRPDLRETVAAFLRRGPEAGDG